ncbi:MULTISPECIES: DUF802 domain-containing protein [unclassified Variovorax]|uniref:DUF802 domain-containing protein n=1 Tax=unclassified Variovorax TaxID=663243 RepID=UPI00076BD9CA|nr:MULTISPECIES: DUF802 domain-containing protein [unclassified Variovorax]KWT98759.1 putative membrane protein [Variovorax sp. WDL1]PNG56178.1 hypothetical protein CHC07_02593 [Variovorax sp. B4]PNG57602.1 hypothetical protein CHC06_02596 [Variovorax sp. B2]VTV09987.1 hypothetical protein WDL1CHR_01034 [Variovorax sp. WDL1]
MNRSLHYFVFFVGLAAVCWVGAGYIGSSPLALAITVLVGAFYLLGALELHRFQQATSTLERAVADLPDSPPSLGPWLEQLHPSLRNAVRLRIEGERVGLPGPALTPYLAGLLVLLGMLGTFLGMVVTLNGTGAALEGASDLQAIRSSLSAPVKGLGLAFGTSVAGVAASAMLGLASALYRRERLQAGQMLDTRIATSLRPWSRAHQREESVKLLQQQVQGMPELVERLQAMMTMMERQSHSLNERLISSQESFHGKAEAAYTELAASVGRSLNESLTESARVAGATFQPVVEAAMAGIAREAAALHGTIELGVQRQLDGLSTRLEATTTTMTQLWQDALAGHRRDSEALSQDLRGTFDQFAQTFERRSASLVEDVSARLEATVGSVSDSWRDALAQQARASERLSGDTQQALTAAAATFEHHSASLLRTVDQAHVALQAEVASRDEQRLAAWTDALQAMAVSLQQEWQQAGARAEGRQQAICTTLAETARDISERTEAQASRTIAEITRLVQAASEAPRAAAEVIGELRQKLSEGMARDNAMLEERGRILETLGTVLDAVNHASAEQRSAIDALVGASADLLDRVGSRFTERVDAEAGKMAEVAAQLTGSAVEVASLGEAFGLAVQLFSQSNDKLVNHLQRVEATLGKSIARSDEQLAYYVAQAREVIDLSIMSQKQIVEDLQQLAASRAPVGSEA